MSGIAQRVRRLLRLREPESLVSGDPYERELLSHDLDAVKVDDVVSEGNGFLAPTLPEVTPDDLYHEFEHDEERPVDPAP